MPKKIRVYELVKELGLTNKEALELCIALGIGVKSHSSSIEDAQADRVRRKADAEGLRRPVQPEEPRRPRSRQGHQGREVGRARRGRRTSGAAVRRRGGRSLGIEQLGAQQRAVKTAPAAPGVGPAAAGGAAAAAGRRPARPA